MHFPDKLTDLLIWHRGALGDLLLAGPAFKAIRHHFPRVRVVGVGHPERWRLLARTLEVAEVWDGEAALWAGLFGEGALPEALLSRLASFQAALVFTPQLPGHLLARLTLAGIAAVHWAPSFSPDCEEHPAVLQSRRLAELGIALDLTPFRLDLGPPDPEIDRLLSGPGPWAAVAPGSGHPCKNWPLSHFFQATRALAWRHGLRIVWVTGPAEAAMFPYVEAMAQAQGQLVLNNRPLLQVAQALSRSALYLGGDSGVTHLAVAAGARNVLALFGPTDPQVWAPRGENVKVLKAPCPDALCAQGELPCPDSHCFNEISPEQVLDAVGDLHLG
jgi:ADP-heptose:LPS heptosyltransferase